MQFISHDIDGVVEIRAKRFEDPRGHFSEIYKKAEFEAAGITADFVQDNKSLSRPRGVVRGLHFQLPPFAQAKLVSVQHGAIYDVAVDIRRSSPTFGRHVGVTLTAELGNQLFIPEGFAHGFCTLEPEVVVIYKVTAYYAPDHDRSVHWADPALAIDWPVAIAHAELSAKDALAPRLSEAPDLF